MYVVPVFNIANVSCLLFMVDRPFQEYTAFVEPIFKYNFAKSELFGKPPDFPQAEFSFRKCAPMAALTKLFLSIPVCVMEKMSQNTNF